MSLNPVTRRGVALAAALALAALPVEAVHGAEDVRAGIGSALSVGGLLLVQAAAIAAALAGRRWAVRLLLAVSIGWIVGALVDHSQVFTDPTAFRDGWASAVPVLALIALNAAAAVFAVAPAMPASWDALKVAGVDAWAAVELERAVVLDVRTARERASGVIPGAIAMSWRHPTAPEGGRGVVVVCSHGARALHAVRALQANDVAARSVSGGMTAYRRQGLPIDDAT